MKFFYVRCSTKEQNESRQIAYAKKQGFEERCIFVDKASGKNADRPALKDMLSRLREGDEVHVTELSRLGRNTKDLLEIVDRFEKMGVQLISKKESIDTTTPAGKLTFHIFASIAEFQRQVILDSAAEGRRAAREQGRPLGGRPKNDPNKMELALHMFANDPSKTMNEICSIAGVSRAAVYNAASNRGITRAQKMP